MGFSAPLVEGIIMNLSEFQKKVAEAETPLIVDFWAPWCGPCKVTKPILEKLADEYAGKVEFLFVNADESQQIVKIFRIMGIPTLIAFQDGKVIGRITGAQNEAAYREAFDRVLEGEAIKVPVTTFDRFLRLGIGTVFVILGINTSNWWLVGLGALFVFWGIYDRCPLWTAITGFFRGRK